MHPIKFIIQEPFVFAHNISKTKEFVKSKAKGIYFVDFWRFVKYLNCMQLKSRFIHL